MVLCAVFGTVFTADAFFVGRLGALFRHYKLPLILIGDFFFDALLFQLNFGLTQGLIHNRNPVSLSHAPIGVRNLTQFPN